MQILQLVFVVYLRYLSKFAVIYKLQDTKNVQSKEVLSQDWTFPCQTTFGKYHNNFIQQLTFSIYDERQFSIHQFIKKLTIQRQKLLCALAYLGKNYHTHLSKDRLLEWMETNIQTHNNTLNELYIKGWFVEEMPHQGAVPILLVNPKRMLEVLDSVNYGF